MAANEDKVLSVPSFSPPPIPAAATTASPAKASARFSETLIGKLDAPLASTGDPIGQSLRLRAYSRIALDGYGDGTNAGRTDGARGDGALPARWTATA